MALPILDGNQSATTLSTILAGGEHTPAHTVVSLGSTAISNITSAVSGSVVSISNFPATQPISGTVTANVDGVPQDNGVPYFPVAYFISPGGSQIQVSDDVGTGLPVRVQEAISGTVTANMFGYDYPNGNITQIPVHNYDEGFAAGIKAVPVLIGNESGGFNDSNKMPISGTVTVGASSVTFNSFVGQRGDGSWQAISLQTGSNYVNANIPGSVTIGNAQQLADTLLDQSAFYAPLQVSVAGASGTVPISGTVTANATVQNATAIAQAVIDESDSYGAVNVNIQSSSGNVAVVGTVTASNPSGALTTRFGSVTTANTAQLTSAVTNASRKYLLVQNIATSTVTIGIGFAPTTTQGIQLTAGAGITFDAFCPTGGVWWLSSATGSNFSILEG